MSGFQSTRGASSVSLDRALFDGLAPDGGLYMPQPLASFDGQPPDLASAPGFPPSARWCMDGLTGEYLDDAVLSEVVQGAFDFPVPIVELGGGLWVMELFHGPTLAFKDFGARFMARLMSALSGSQGPSATRTVLVATSGDTGGAVAAAFHGLAGYRVVTLFPEGGISDRQRRQMSTLGGNVLAVAVEGTFDDCQALAKRAFQDGTLSADHRLTSANSINIGRLLPQASYYVHAARSFGWDAAPIRFVVPSGNLGNLCAGLLARVAGMPAAGFLAATNRNDAFVRYLSGTALSTDPSVATVSNAMDVGRPSNLERITALFESQRSPLRAEVAAVSVDDAETIECIRTVFDRSGHVLDPHTAVAVRAHERAAPTTAPTVVLATAHPAKFPDVVEAAIGEPVAVPARLAVAMDREETVVRIPPTLAALADALRRGVPLG